MSCRPRRGAGLQMAGRRLPLQQRARVPHRRRRRPPGYSQCHRPEGRQMGAPSAMAWVPNARVAQISPLTPHEVTYRATRSYPPGRRCEVMISRRRARQDAATGGHQCHSCRMKMCCHGSMGGSRLRGSQVDSSTGSTVAAVARAALESSNQTRAFYAVEAARQGLTPEALQGTWGLEAGSARRTPISMRSLGS